MGFEEVDQLFLLDAALMQAKQAVGWDQSGNDKERLALLNFKWVAQHEG